MVQNMLDLMIDVTLAKSANFFQLDAASDDLVITHVRGDAESQYLVGLRLNRKQGLPGLSLCNSRIVVIGDLPSNPDWLDAVDPVNAARKRNVINLPVASKDRTLGVIQIFNFQQAELDLLTVLSNRLAAEMEHRKEIDAARRSSQRLLTLVDMLGEVAGTLDRNQLLHMVTEHAARLVDAERSSIFLVNPDTSEMIFQVAYRTPDEMQAPEYPKSMDSSIRPSSLYRQDRTGSHSPNQAANLKHSEFSYFNRSAITVPLRSGLHTQDHSEDRKHALGGLMVLNKANASFQEEDARLMGILANQAGIFLQVAEMYESTEELFLGVIKSLNYRH